MYPSHPQFDELLSNLYHAATVYYSNGAEYYGVINQKLSDISKATQNFRDAGKAYLNALFVCEQYLLSVNRDEQLEIELVHIQAIRHSVQITQSHL